MPVEMLEEFNVDDHQDIPRGIVLPAGKHRLRVEGTEKGSYQKGDVLLVFYQVMAGPEKGETVIQHIQLYAENDTARNIAKADLAKLARACGKHKFRNTEMLHGSRVVAHTGMREYNGREYMNWLRFEPDTEPDDFDEPTKTDDDFDDEVPF